MPAKKKIEESLASKAINKSKGQDGDQMGESLKEVLISSAPSTVSALMKFFESVDSPLHREGRDRLHKILQTYEKIVSKASS